MEDAQEPISAATAGGAGDRLTRIWLLQLVVLAVGTLLLAALTLGLLPFRVLRGYAVTPVEPQTIEGALRVKNGQPLYRDFLKEEPITPITYGPGVYYLPGWIARSTGGTGVEFVLQTGRVIAALSGVLTCALVFLLARRTGARGAWALLSLLPLFWFPRLSENWAKFLPHQTALAMSLAGWALLPPPGSPLRRAWPRDVLAAAAWVLGFLYHPTVLVGQFASLAEKLLGRSRPRGRAFLRELLPYALYGTMCIVIIVGLQLATKGLWKVNAVDAMAICRFDPAFAWQNVRFFHWEGLTILGAMVLFAAIYLREPLFAGYCVLALVESALMMKQGSGGSYLAGSFALWGIAFARVVNRTWHGPAGPRVNRNRLVVFSAVLLAQIIGVSATIPSASVPHWEVPVPSQEEVQAVAGIIRESAPKTPLYLDAYFAQRVGETYPYADPYHTSLLAQHGLADLRPHIADLKQQKFDLVVGNLMYAANARYHDAPAVPSELRAALLANYNLSKVGEWLAVWVPQGAAQASSPN